jgi:protein-S-isoprenylcysteine O-methyltransferase Ste14
MKKRIGIQGGIVFIAILMAILLSRFVFPRWHAKAFDKVLDMTGIVLILLGFLFRISARGYKEENSSQGKRLVIDGPYFLIRNPMYFGTLLIGVGVISVLFEWWTLPLFLFVFLLIYIPQIRKEENSLAARFGGEYRDYCRLVPKYFPKPSLTTVRNCLLLRLSWVKKEWLSLILVILAVVVMETWEDVRGFSQKGFFKELSEISGIIFLTAAVILLWAKKYPNNHASKNSSSCLNRR